VRWLADECVDAGLVSHLRTDGHDVVSMAETATAASDDEVLIQAQTEGRVLLTEDKDFGDLVFRRGQPVPGVVLLRIASARHRLKIIRLDRRSVDSARIFSGGIRLSKRLGFARGRCQEDRVSPAAGQDGRTSVTPLQRLGAQI